MSSEMTLASTAEVRAWARKKGLAVGVRGHLPLEVIKAFNKAHRKVYFENKNPWQGRKEAAA